MREAQADLWTFPADWRVVTTNGTVRRDGCAVMGRGCAREAKRKYPDLPKLLGDFIASNGNSVALFPQFRLITFPVKYDWWNVADFDLIRRSTEELHAFIRRGRIRETVVMPRPGCGNGSLVWGDVRPILADVLPDSVTVVTWPRRA